MFLPRSIINDSLNERKSVIPRSASVYLITFLRTNNAVANDLIWDSLLFPSQSSSPFPSAFSGQRRRRVSRYVFARPRRVALRRSVIRSKSRLRSSSLTRLNNERGCRRSTSFQPPSTSTPFSRSVGRTRELALSPRPSLSFSLSLERRRRRPRRLRRRLGTMCVEVVRA